MQNFEVHPATGKAENNKDPSFGLVTIDVGENRSEDVGLTVGERRLNRLEDIGDVCFERREGYLIQLDASRAGLLKVRDHFADSRNEEVELDVCEHLKDIPAMT